MSDEPSKAPKNTIDQVPAKIQYRSLREITWSVFAALTTFGEESWASYRGSTPGPSSSRVRSLSRAFSLAMSKGAEMREAVLASGNG
jgi:hypothetical protein